MGQLSILKAVILGAVQGATEFLPVSSSGHLVIFQDLLNFELSGGPLVAFDVCLHLGTLISVVAVFWRDIAQMLASLAGRSIPNEDLAPPFARKMVLYIVLATIPAVAAALAFKEPLEGLFSNTVAAGAMLIVTGFILFFTRFSKVRHEGLAGMNFMRAMLIGCAQAVAIIPGISRSGSTISAALYAGIERPLAARFSFLLSIPAIGGAFALEFKELVTIPSDMLVAVVAGTAVAAVVGFVCIKWLLSIIRRGSFYAFAYYCWSVGALVLAYKLLIR
jgi:undecaprenyl-diphosphatase